MVDIMERKNKIKNQGPDWGDINLMLGEMMETEKQLILKTA